MVVLQIQQSNGFGNCVSRARPNRGRRRASTTVCVQTQVAPPTRTQRIMENISVGGEAGGVYSYNALKRLDNIWSNICTQPIGACNASQMVDLFPAVSPEMVVREARLEDCWEVAETYCSAYYPGYSFPLDVVMRVDSLMAMVMGFSTLPGCKRICLVAVIGSSVDETDDFKIGSFDAKFSLNKGYVAGTLTVDTVADFLPRKGPLRKRRTGIAYISKVAVGESFRRKGIAKRLIWKAEALAKNWGCRAISLHCDPNKLGATKLYKDQGFRSIKIPKGATWPQPKVPDTRFNFMMKLLNNNNTQTPEQFR